ncbi:SPOR domain-containing protein [Rubellimicrobium roseum]|uniref:SPOR domain-containing protein n=1 Tax=Rubellimicrobium roseum TaxID=687525 RepID=A0A5C4NJS9_9RHOB|nr:SPOR domain-containing protein [Rubellimicrobium roseum]TNC73356.1 SPOR domain-containing protein [Rubellimicrobium roseum]
MADWTANSSFGALSASRDTRAARGPDPRATGPRAERFGPQKPTEAPRASSAHAALAEYNAAEGGPLAKARLFAWGLGGALSLALVAGIGVWGYKVVLREVLGLPVVAAAEGPMRVQPSDPGGQVVPSQGLAVNEIPAAGTAAPPSDVLMLAPPTPGLAEEDMEVVLQTRAEEGEVLASDAPDAPVPGGSPVAIVPSNRALTLEEMQDIGARGTVAATLPTPAGSVEAPSALAQAASVAATELPQATVIIPPPPPEAPAPADEVATAEIAPEAAGTAVPAVAAPAEEAPVATVAVIPADVPGVAAALRPLTRPARTVVLSTAAEAADEPAPAAAAPAPEPAASAAVPAGAALIQLGAFDSAEIAAAEWDRLQSEFGEFLGDKERVIQEAQSGGRTFYRLRASGFADRSDANRLCAALTAESADCIPVRAD